MKYTNKDIKKFPKKSVIYKIYFKNSKSNKVYIGSASGKLGFYGRWKSHISSLSNGKSKNGFLINEWDSLNECVRNNNFNSNGIRSVIIGKCIHYKGFYFSYEILNKREVLDIEDKFKINANNRKYYYYKS